MSCLSVEQMVDDHDDDKQRMEKKYQVFVSSTRNDLEEERDAATRAILEIGHIPVGMEMFSAADDDSWTLIKRQIDQSDYYIVIVAHRYGSTAADGISYTEKEYDYATECGIPVLGFIIEETAPWPNTKRDTEAAKHSALQRFKNKVKAKQVAFWTDANALQARVLAALPKQINLVSRPGWVRGTLAAGPEVLAELSRLSAENAGLRARLTETPPPDLAFHLGSVDAEIAHLDYQTTVVEIEVHLVVHPRDQRHSTIPLGLITTILADGDNTLAVEMLRSSGVDSEGPHGDSMHLVVTGPRRARLWGRSAEAPDWLRGAKSLEFELTLRPVGFETAYVLRGTLRRHVQHETWHLGVEDVRGGS